MSFQPLKETYQILVKPKLSELESLLTEEIGLKHLSLMYNLLVAHSKANTNLVRRKWESDLGMQLDEDQ